MMKEYNNLENLNIASLDDSSKHVPVQFFLSAEEKKRLKLYCLDNDMKMTEVIKKVVVDYLTKEGY